MSWTYRQLQVEIGKRLKELRLNAAHGISQEEVARRAKERHLEIGATTIRNWEKGRGNLTLVSLHALLTFYGVTVGDFFRFAVEAEDSRLVADFADLIRDPKQKVQWKAVIEAVREP